MSEVYGTRRRHRRRGHRLLITLIVLLVIVGGLLVAADRVGVSYAERLIGDKVAEQVAAQKAKSATPAVTIEGVPFLTQVLSGKYQEIKIELADFSGPAGQGQTISMPLLDIRARDLDAPLDTIRTGTGTIVARTVTGTGTIDYAQVVKLINEPGVKLSYQGGKLVFTAPVKAAGQTYDVTGAATLTAKNGTVQVRFSDVTAEGLPNLPIVRNLVDAYVRNLAVDLRVPTLPLNLTLQKVEPQPDGLRMTTGASNVSLSGGGI